MQTHGPTPRADGGALRTRLTKAVRRSPLARIGAALLIGATACSPVHPDYRRIAIADWRVEADCRGPDDAEVTVWLEHGIGPSASASTWDRVVGDVAAFAHVCRYSRPGAGRSDAAPSYGPDLYLRRVDALLDAMSARGDLVVVGHSFGGYLARAMAQAWPERVRAVLLVDAIGETLGLRAATGAADWEDVPTGGEAIDVRAFEEAMRPALATPVIVLSRGKDISARWDLSQTHLLSLDPDARHVVAHDSGHMVPIDDAESVVEAIRTAVEARRP